MSSGLPDLLAGQRAAVGDTVRVNVILIDAAADRQVWAESYERNATDVFAVESEVARPSRRRCECGSARRSSAASRRRRRQPHGLRLLPAGAGLGRAVHAHGTGDSRGHPNYEAAVQARSRFRDRVGAVVAPTCEFLFAGLRPFRRSARGSPHGARRRPSGSRPIPWRFEPRAATSSSSSRPISRERSAPTASSK